MKRLAIYGLVLVLGLASCRKNDNEKLPELSRVPLPSLSLDPSSDTKISPADPASFEGKVIINMKFPEDIHPKKFTAVLMKNGNTSTVKVIQDDITTFPVTVTLTGAQLASLFGAAIADGDKFRIGVNITTQDGKVYEAFPLVGEPYGAGVANTSGGTATFIEFTKPCKYDPAIYVGDFVVVTDEWADYTSGSAITVTAIGKDTLAFSYLTAPSIPIYVKVDTLENTTSVAKQSYGEYGGTPLSAASVAGAANYVDPCTGTLSVRLQHTSGSSDYGIYTIVIKKK